MSLAGAAARFIVGIDLGTTHTVLAYAPLTAALTDSTTSLFAIEQLVGAGAVQALPLLPSVRYHAAAGELAPEALQLPWTTTKTNLDAAPVVLGQWARNLGAQVPGRLVSSAKSWLSHTAVDRLAPILPWGAPADIPKVSPVHASASYLAYARAAWNTHFPDAPLEQQELVLTVPASFDAGARALTLQAATEAGLSRLRLLEEPQAALYDWLQRHRATLATELAASRLVLVCDVGGGTTDLSLIAVAMENGVPVLQRIGVGNHLMLGGDNMDLALAHRVESRLGLQAPLSASRMAQLMERCRQAKELLLSDHAPEQTSITLLGAGARLVGGSRSVVLTRQEVQDTVVDGFFPRIAADEPPPVQRRGMLEFGLPYAREPAITRHIAAFLQQHAAAARTALGLPVQAQDTALVVPDTLLLNGGVFRAQALGQRLQQVLATWRGAPLRLLHNDWPDVAVARGAVAYALAQRGLGLAIGGGTAHSYCLLLEEATATRAARGICILPRGSAIAQELHLRERVFLLRVGQPVRFHVYSASADRAQPLTAGQVLALDDADWVRLPPITTVLPANQATAGKQKIPVHLVAALTEIGTLELHCVSQADPVQRWLLEFDLRQAQATPQAPEAPQALPAAPLKAAIAALDRVFGTSAQAVPAKEVRQLRAQLEQVLGAREQWPLPVLRQLFDALWQRARGRRRSAEHERVWLNLAGYCLRPGFGHALDAWRSEQLWTLFPAGVQFAKDKQVCAHWWTLWRRVAGGLAATQQLRLLDDFAYNVQGDADALADGAAKPVPGSAADMLRLGATLERIPAAYKVEIGDWLLGRIQKALRAANPDLADVGVTLWALGRLGARVPLYGSAHDVVPADNAAVWVEALLALDWKRLEAAAFATAQLARLSDDRSRDLALSLRQRCAQRLAAADTPAAWQTLVLEHVPMDALTQSRLVGESLPPGLTLLE